MANIKFEAAWFANLYLGF